MVRLQVKQEEVLEIRSPVLVECESALWIAAEEEKKYEFFLLFSREWEFVFLRPEQKEPPCLGLPALEPHVSS